MTTHRNVLVVFVAALFFAGCASPTGETGSEALSDGFRHSGDPAIVALFINQVGGGHAKCTGTVIGDYTVLTAAHCFEGNPQDVDVYFGDDPQAVLDGGSDPSFISLLTSSQFFQHPGYDPVTNVNDAAFIWLPSPSPVAPAYGMASPDGLEGYGVKMIAYGANQADSAGRGSGPTVKQIGYATISVIDDRFIQTDGTGRWTNQCRGDSGSPLLLPGDNGDYILGISSYGDATCTEFSVFQRLDTVLPWIQRYLY